MFSKADVINACGYQIFLIDVTLKNLCNTFLIGSWINLFSLWNSGS